MPDRPSDTQVGYYAGPSIDLQDEEEVEEELKEEAYQEAHEEEEPYYDDGLMHPIEADSSTEDDSTAAATAAYETADTTEYDDDGTEGPPEDWIYGFEAGKKEGFWEGWRKGWDDGWDAKQ